jgi:ABC-type transport system substrate-binding protein
MRRALAHALDREALLGDDHDREPGSAGAGLIPPSLPAHSHDIALPYDPARARELLAEAGFEHGHGLRTLQLLVELGQEGPSRAVEQWAEVGVSIELERLSGAAFDEAIERSDLWWHSWVADYPDPEGFLDTLLVGNPSIHRDEQLLELLARARSSRNRDERWRIYREADRRLVQELVSVIPLLHTTAVVVARPWVEGVRYGPLRPPMLDELTVRRHAPS